MPFNTLQLMVIATGAAAVLGTGVLLHESNSLWGGNLLRVWRAVEGARTP